MSAVANLTPQQPSIVAAMAERYGMRAEAFEATLRHTVVPKETTREEFAAFLMVAKEYDLNPILREVYAFPRKGGGIQPIVSVDGWLRIINSHPAFDGMAFHDQLDHEGKLIAITCEIWRKDRSHSIQCTEYLSECRRNTDPWRQWPHRLLRHKSMIQAARYAFGFSGVLDPDEAERWSQVGQLTIKKGDTPALAESLKSAATPRPPQPTPPPPPPPPEDEEDDGAALENGSGYHVSEMDPPDLERERLWDAGKEAASGGMARLGEWAANLTREERDKLGVDYSAELTRLAREASRQDEAAAGGGVT